MKKVFCLAIALILMSGMAYAAEVQPRSGVKTADALVTTGSGTFAGILVVTDGSNTCTVTVYDNTSAASTKLMPTVIVPAAASYGMAYAFNPPLPYYTGIYVDITTSGTCSFDVYFQAK